MVFWAGWCCCRLRFQLYTSEEKWLSKTPLFLFFPPRFLSFWTRADPREIERETVEEEENAFQTGISKLTVQAKKRKFTKEKKKVGSPKPR
jgi:hypothetical protein